MAALITETEGINDKEMDKNEETVDTVPELNGEEVKKKNKKKKKKKKTGM